jgi:hypothetical protein
MKNPKVLLSAIVLFAVIGFIFAVHASTRGSLIYTGPSAGAPCTRTVFNFTISTRGTWTYASAIYNAPCTLTFITPVS